jgi:hypothetical protein
VSEAASNTWHDTSGGGRTWLVALILLAGSVLTVAATVLGNGNVIVAVAPIMLASVGALVWILPLRFPLFALILLGLTIDSTGEGPWNSPLSEVGMLLHVNLAKSLPGVPVPFPGTILALGVLLLVHVHRVLSGSTTDSAARKLPAKVMLRAMGVSALTVIALVLLGFKNHGDMKMAKIQVQAFLVILLVGYLCASSFRGVRDYRIVGAIVIVSACIKAAIAVYVMQVIKPTHEEFATSHGDSLLFACAMVLLIVKLAEQPIRRNLLACVLLLPPITAGMVANDRRLVWVQVLLALAAFWMMSRRTRFKQFIIRCFLLALPLIAAYVAAGWNSQSELFSPVRTLRSVGDSEVDSSTMYRDLENFNLLATLRLNIVLGSGFGHPFLEEVKLPDISFFEEYRYMPHNAVLGLWAFCGPFGFTGLTTALTVAMFLAARSYRAAQLPDERVAAFMVIGTIIIYMIHCWGDIGFSERRTFLLVGPSLAIAGQLAMSTGAWRLRPRAHSRLAGHR